MKLKKLLDELKEDVANGNLDPYNYGTDDDGNYVYDIYEDIETWEQEYETATGKENPDRGQNLLPEIISVVLHKCQTIHNTTI